MVPELGDMRTGLGAGLEHVLSLEGCQEGERVSE